MKSANLAEHAVTGAILLKCLTAHTPRGDVNRGFNLMLETMVDDASLSCVQGLPRLKHVEPLPQLLYSLSCTSSYVFALIFGTMIKSSGQGEVWAGYVFYGKVNARELRPGPATFRCNAEGLEMNGQPDEALKLVCSHANSEKLRPFINTVTYTTVLSGFAMAEHDKDVSLSACQSASCSVAWYTASCYSCLFSILISIGESPPVFTWCNMKGFDLLRTFCQPAHFTVLWILLST